MRTIQKVVSEIIYNKILNDAVKGEEDYVIKGEDIKDILLYKNLKFLPRYSLYHSRQDIVTKAILPPVPRFK